MDKTVFILIDMGYILIVSYFAITKQYTATQFDCIRL